MKKKIALITAACLIFVTGLGFGIYFLVRGNNGPDETLEEKIKFTVTMNADNTAGVKINFTAKKSSAVYYKAGDGEFILSLEDSVTIPGIANRTIIYAKIVGKNNNVISCQRDLTELPEAGFKGIWKAEDFLDIVNDMDGEYQLMNDIALPNDFEPIGDAGLLSDPDFSAGGFNAFTGELNGNSYNISYMLDVDYNNTGLFIINEGHIYNLTVEADITTTCSGFNNAIVAAFNFGLIENVVSKGSVDGVQGCSGIAGINYQSGIIRNCGNYATITNVISGTYCAAGIASRASGGIIEYCFNAGDITGDACVGGIMGASSSGIYRYNYNIGTITGAGGDHTAGIVGRASNDTISCCYNAGTIISGGGGHTGGIAGALRNDLGMEESIVEYCYNVGDVIVGGVNEFPIVGASLHPEDIIRNCVYCNETAWESIPPNFTGIFAVSLADMEQQETFEAAGFDFENVFIFVEGSRYAYPQLRGNLQIAQ